MRRFQLLVGCVVFLGLQPLGWSDEFSLGESKQKKRVKLIKRQTKCLERCYSKSYRRFYRCRPSSLYCNAKSEIYTRNCFTGCKAPWFCRGFRKTQARCGQMCLLSERKKWLRRNRWRRYKGRLVRRRISKKAYRRWLRKSSYACQKLCKLLNIECGALVPTLPPATRIPNLRKM